MINDFVYLLYDKLKQLNIYNIYPIHILMTIDVLLLDDNLELLKLYEIVLKKLNLSFNSFNNPVDALDKFDNKYKLVITDYDLNNNLTGVGFSDKIREKGYDGPIIMITGNDIESLEPGKNSINSTYKKPVGYHDLTCVVRGYLNQ